MDITPVGDYNLDYLTPLEKENLDTVVLPYGFTVASPCLQTRVCKYTKTHIDYILAENIDDEKSFVFDTPFKTDHFCSVLFTEVSAGKQMCIRIPGFEKTKHVTDAFCRTMFVYLLSSALEKHALFKNGSWPMKNTPRFHHPKIGLLILNYDRNHHLS